MIISRPRDLANVQCYHCPTGHPALPAVTDLSKYWVETAGAHIQHYATDKPDAESLGNVSTYMYPNASMTVSYVAFLSKVAR